MELRRRRNDVIGVMVSGLQVQVAHLCRERGGIHLKAVDRATLVERLDQDLTDLDDGEIVSEGEEVLGLTAGEETPVTGTDFSAMDDDDREPESNLEVLYRLFGKFPVRRCRLALALMEAHVHYTDVQNGSGLRGNRLRRFAMEEVLKQTSMAGDLPSEETMVLLHTGEDRLLAISQEDPLEALSILDELKPFIGQVQVGLIDPIEVSLMNLVRLSHPSEPHVTAVVFVGEDFSRVVFMRDGHYLALSQPINEGFASPHVLHTVCSRIQYECDVADIPEIGRIILTGECRAIDAHPFIAGQFPNARVGYVALPELDLNGLEEKDAALVSTFAVPIALAWKSLCPQEPSFYESNFLPRQRRRQQNPLELAWHGVLLLTLLSAAVILTGTQARDRSRQIDRLRLSVEMMEEQIREDNAYVQMVADLKAEISDYERNFALIDSLSSGKRDWSGTLQEVSRATRSTGRLWLQRFSTLEKGLDIRRGWGAGVPPEPTEILVSGTASRLDRVPVFAERVGNGSIRSLGRSRIRDRRVYGFELKTPLQPDPQGRSRP